jgi:hypothetical protein
MSVTPHGVGAEASFSRVRDDIVWRYCAASIMMILAGDNPVLDTTNTQNNSEMKSDVEEGTLHQMAKVHEILEMWQGSQNLCATQKDTYTQSKEMTAIGCNSHMEEIVKAFWSFFQHDGVVAFILSP